MPKEITTLLTFFGGTGDLAKRKLYPSTYNLFKKGFLQEHFAIIGTARQELTTDEFRELVRTSIADFIEDQANAEEFVSHFYYIQLDITDQAGYANMLSLNNELDAKYSLKGNRIFYMSVAPRFFGTVAKYLKSENLLTENGEFNRLMIEKPFGSSYDTAEALQNELSEAFDENQIYRIDHYLGKEMVQNIAAVRFGNPLFDAAWNKDYIENIQVTLSEVLGVEERAGYYDTAGALRDMIQNHTMQVIGWLAMEKPASFTDKEIRAAKNAAFNSLKIYNTPEEVAANFVRGQYGESADGSQKKYLDELDVPADSQNNTYVAGKLQFDMPRWEGVPFYIRSGKRLAAKSTRVDVVFKKGLNIFGEGVSLDNPVLSILIDPKGGIEFKINAKDITSSFATRTIDLDWQVSDEDKAVTPEPYERMIHDAMNGDGSNFADWNGVGTAWRFVDAIQAAWDAKKELFPNYVSGSMGPVAADELLAKDGNEWIFKG
ncbi:glucose-6-phosphate dehydrogenase [Weissella paramesenteroides]|uniref:glucose-6-phosphate dehydrogenase n=1 Tax=Weissella paramesenteroides TaxID=1249 RepID=UPI00123AE4F7|nr:glucose-6-phosphate dehydrogenase [Weissella paramesenteroides]KAA8445274.1 glucose-6-phosphate dehydrogenase [Weissella paramesenteroides]KAA8451852.1 glucose-6-phosphate dehydrogenase [Weissella paramesenteroides]MCS9983842.1 glucose-6-phosphate dehydrogenase [Weissella paramesenteroides]MCS9997507.1 glucose-6-phosphate dehydrogenase [Weissella paramesenteroides]MCT0259919.1 glucose-6-phosphate dehydrogenase [Weissella paramesenteroides]